MWSAIKNDLFEFVATVQSDTKETLSKVIISPKDIHLSSSETSDHTAKKKKSYEERNEKMIEELTQSYSTYAEDIDQKYQTAFEKYKSSFSLSAHSSDIARILEWETEVSKYYCDLVPDTLSAELFWARYYFKLDLLKSKSLLANTSEEEDEEEEELTWDDDAAGAVASGTETNENLQEVVVPQSENSPISTIPQPITTSTSSHSSQDTPPPSSPPSDKVPSPNISTNQPTESLEAVAPVEKTNDNLLSSLQNENSYLTNRVTSLENEVQRLKEELKYYHTHYPATLSFPNSESSVSSIDEDHLDPQQKKSVYPIESYVKVGESGGESDGLVVLSNETNSDSDFISKSKGQQKKKFSSGTSSAKTTRLATIASTEETVREGGNGNTERFNPPTQEGQRDDEEDEEEVGWDDSGW